MIVRAPLAVLLISLVLSVGCDKAVPQAGSGQVRRSVVPLAFSVSEHFRAIGPVVLSSTALFLLDTQHRDSVSLVSIQLKTAAVTRWGEDVSGLQRPTRVFPWSGDSILVWDSPRRQLSIWAPDMSTRRHFEVELPQLMVPE